MDQMQDFWNEFELKKPPLITIKIDQTLFVKKLRPVFDNFFKQDVIREEFSQSAALLSRLMARRKNSFRKFKGFKIICKLNAALCRLLRVDIPRVFENFHSSLPDLDIDECNGKTEVPSRNNFDYVLIRIMSMNIIHNRINECCKEAAEHIAMMLRMNFFMEINTLLLSVLAKIRNHSVVLGNTYATIYSQLIPYRKCFPQYENLQFLPEHCKLPDKLIIIHNELSTSSRPTTDNAQIELRKTFSSIGPITPKQRKHVDLGTPISRDTLKPIWDVSKLDTVEMVQNFIAEENRARKNQSKSCKTKSISLNDWNVAVHIFNKKIRTTGEKKAISTFKKFLKNNI